MLIGAHVSTAAVSTRRSSAGPSAAANLSRSSTRARACGGRPTTARRTSPRFREAMDGSPVEAVVIHAVYLINCATKDTELRKKSLASLTHALRIGDGIGAAGVVLHPGAQKGEPLGPSMKRAAKVIAAALKDSRELPAPARADRRPQRAARPQLRGDGGADRAGRRRQAPRPLPRLLPHVRAGLRHHRRPAPRRGARRSRRQGRPGPPRAASTSTTPPRRSAPAATATPTSAKARWAQGPRRLPLRAPLRGPPGDAGDAGPAKEGPWTSEVTAAKRLRRRRPQAPRKQPARAFAETPAMTETATQPGCRIRQATRADPPERPSSPRSAI